MSPEVLQGSGYDFKCDVWSLGCISYELCALISPFKDETKKMSLYDLFTKIISANYKPLSSSRYSAELLYIIDQMLIVNPEQRVSIHDVVEYCEKQLEQLQMKLGKSPKENQKSNNHNRKGSALDIVDDEEAEIVATGRPQIDPCLIMDDIIEKLHLLDYKASFCVPRKLKSMSRTYFAIDSNDGEGSEIKVAYLVALCYWLMSLGYEDMWR